MRSLRTGLLACAAVLTLALGSAAVAQNLVVNPGFEDALGPEWTVTYVGCSSTSFQVSSPSTIAYHTGNYGLQYLVPTTNNFTAHAYYSQILTGLTPGASYDCSCWIKFAGMAGYNRPDKYWVYMETIGGLGSVVAPAKGSNVTGWVQYYVAQKADASGNLEVRLHMDKYATTASKQCDGYIDDVSVVAVPEPSSLVALLAGLPFVGMAIRRRR